MTCVRVFLQKVTKVKTENRNQVEKVELMKLEPKGKARQKKSKPAVRVEHLSAEMRKPVTGVKEEKQEKMDEDMGE
jgi:hypothetical protein